MLTLLIAILSLAAFVYFNRSTNGYYFTFYLLPGRIWELCAGALVALIKTDGVQSNKGCYLEKHPTLEFLLGIMGLVLIFVTVILYDDETPKKIVLWSIPPVLGTCLILVVSPCSFAAQLLSTPFLCSLGDMSYSMYLWHWPFIFAADFLIQIDETNHLKARVMVVSMSILWSFIVFRGFETPIRRLVFSPVTSLSLGACIVVATLWFTHSRRSLFVLTNVVNDMYIVHNTVLLNSSSSYNTTPVRINIHQRIDTVHARKTYFDHQLVISNTRSTPNKKNLIYFTIAMDPLYCRLLRITLFTIRATSDLKNTDIMVIADDLYTPYLLELEGIDFIWTVSRNKDGVHGSMRKVEIFMYPNISRYDKIFYIDSDTFICKDVEVVLFPFIKSSSHLYVVRENSHEHMQPYFGFQNYTQDQLDFFKKNDIGVFNAGEFAFRNSPEMLHHFQNVYNSILNFSGTYFYEQSFLNYYFNLGLNTAKLNDTFLTPRVNIRYSNPFTNITFMYHFTGSTDGIYMKLARAKPVFNATLPEVYKAYKAKYIDEE